MGSLYLEPKNSFPRLSNSWPILVETAVSLFVEEEMWFQNMDSQYMHIHRNRTHITIDHVKNLFLLVLYQVS